MNERNKSLIECVLDWTAPVAGTSRTIPGLKLLSSYDSFIQYNKEWSAIVTTEFLIEMDQDAMRPLGRPVAILLSGREFAHPTYGQIAFGARGPMTDCILRVENSGYCFFHFESKKIFMSRISEVAFRGESELFFSGVDFKAALLRFSGIDHLKKSNWMGKILAGRCPPVGQKLQSETCQGHAIRSCLDGESGTWLWQGPPGTGKSKTIADLIKKIGTDVPVLAMAHSNDAVLNLLDELLSSGIRQTDISWCVSKQRLKEFPPESRYLRFINSHNNPTTTARVFLSTCSHSVVLSPMVFTWVIVDEAAFCPEHDSLVALMRLNDDPQVTSKFLLVGDPAQLSPVMKCSATVQNFASLMARCMVESCGSTVTFDISYRVGSLCAEFLRDTFYPLCTTFRANDDHQLLMQRMLKSGDPFPEMTFLDVPHGAEVKKGTSYVNDGEAEQVIILAQRLIENGVLVQDIVAIAPYAEQVELIEEKIKEVSGCIGIQAKTVHGMQGTESKFVIMSTVRSDNAHTAGFIDEPHMICVSLSRQKTFLVVLGHAKFLHQHTHHWSNFLRFLNDKGHCVESLAFLNDSTRGDLVDGMVENN